MPGQTKAMLAKENLALRRRIARLEKAAPQGEERELRDGAVKFRQLADSIADIFFVFDKDLRYVYWNKASEIFTGIPAALALGRSMLEIFPLMLDAQRVERIYRQALETQQPQMFLTEFRFEDKTYVFEISAYPLVDDLAVFARDITERQRAEAALRQSEERYQNFISQSFEAISRTEFDQPIDVSLPVETQIDLIYENAYMAECNQAMADAYNISSPQDFVGARLIDAHGGKDNPVNRAAFRKFIENGYKSVNDETIEVTADGKPVWFLSNTIGTVEHGRLVRLWGTALDVTEHKQAETALRESEQKYSAMFRQTVIPAALVQLPENVFVDANEAVEKMLGFNRLELVGKNSADSGLLAVAERDRILVEFRRGTLTAGVEAQFFKKSGEELIALVKANVVEFGGQKYALITIQDVTERRRAERELARAHEQLQKLSRRLFEAQEQERRAVARELHDEIGQTLTGLKLLLEAAQRSGVEKIPAKLGQAQKIVSGLIETTSRLSLNLHPPVLDDARILPALQWLLDTFSSQTEFQIDFIHAGVQDKTFDPAVVTAAYRLAQAALTNVARHAGVNRARLRVSADATFLELSVEDAGSGFDVKATQARKTTSGLTGMSERIRLLAGDFMVDSAPGRGTRVVFRLPLNRDEALKDAL